MAALGKLDFFNLNLYKSPIQNLTKAREPPTAKKTILAGVFQ